MPRKRNPLRDCARKLWEADKSRPLKSIAEELGISESLLRKWKCDDKWEPSGNVTLRNAEKERYVTKKALRKVMEAMDEAEELTEKEKAFCLHYVQAFNGASAARQAGYEPRSAKQIAWELLRKPRIREEVQRLKEIKHAALLLGDKEDVLALHWRIAFADLSDFVEWGRATVPVMAMYGPVQVTDPETGEKTPLLQEVNDLRFRESSEVDGQLVSEVKLGRNGASIKLADRQKSLAFLERYFEMNPMDQHRKAFDLARLEMERKKQGEGDEVEDDGFIEALQNSINEVWRDETEGDLPV